MSYPEFSGGEPSRPEAMRAAGDERRYARQIDCGGTRMRREDEYTGRGGVPRDAAPWERPRPPRT